MMRAGDRCPKCRQPAENAEPVTTPILGKGIVKLLGTPGHEGQPTITHEANRLHGWQCPCGHRYPD